MKYPVCLLLFLLALPVFSQTTIKGRISDDKKLAMPSVTIRLKNLPDSSIYKALGSDTAGNFIFKNIQPGDYVLEAGMIGYKSLTIKFRVGTDTLINLGLLSMSPSSNQLKEVAIKAQTPLIEKQIDRTVVNVDQQITSAGTNAFELLKKLPGVEVIQDGQITLNGKSGVNVTIDGKTTYLAADDLANLLTNTPSSEIQKIEIMTNPSANYDAEGTGGIINIIKKKNTKSGLNGGVTGSFGQGYYDRYNSSLVLNYKTDKFNLYLNNSYGYNKGFSKSNVTSDIMNGNSLYSEQISTNTGVTINKAFNSSVGLDLYLSKKTTLTLTGNFSEKRYFNNLTAPITFADSNRNKTGSENFSALNIDKPLNYTTGVQLLHQLDTTGRQWSADVDYSNFRYIPGQYNTTNNYDAGGNLLSQDNVFIAEARTLSIYGARVDYTQPLPGNGKLETGLKTSYVKTINNSTYYNQVSGQNLIDSAQSDYDINSENINAAYINFNRQYKNITVQAGVRAEQTVMKGQQLLTNAGVDQNYFGLFPTLFLNDKLDDQNNLNFQFGRRVDRPDYHELVPFKRPLSPTISFVGNPNLKPDFNWHTELTCSWQNSFYITAAYDIDRNYLRTLYYLDSNKTTITRRPTNVQGAHSWDIVVGYNKDLSNWFTTNTNVTIYQNSFNGSAAGFSLNDPGFATIDLVTNNSFHISDKLSGEADLEYESKRQFVGSVFGAYSVLSFALKQKIFHDQGSITINANNVLNTESRSATDHYLNLNQYGYGHIYSRYVSVTINYRFGSGKLTKTQNKSGSAEEQQRARN